MFGIHHQSVFVFVLQHLWPQWAISALLFFTFNGSLLQVLHSEHLALRADLLGQGSGASVDDGRTWFEGGLGRRCLFMRCHIILHACGDPKEQSKGNLGNNPEIVDKSKPCLVHCQNKTSSMQGDESNLPNQRKISERPDPLDRRPVE